MNRWLFGKIDLDDRGFKHRPAHGVGHWWAVIAVFDLVRLAVESENRDDVRATDRAVSRPGAVLAFLDVGLRTGTRIAQLGIGGEHYVSNGYRLAFESDCAGEIESRHFAAVAATD